MPRRAVRVGWIDFLVVIAATAAFAAAALFPHHRPPGPPSDETIQAMATELGVTAGDFRRAVAEVPPPARGSADIPSERAEHFRLLADALAVQPTRLEAVLRKYMPPPPRF